MVIIRERKPNMAFEKLRVPYSRLASAVFTIGMYFLDQAFEEEVGIILEAEQVSEADAKKALLEIKAVLTYLDQIRRATTFDDVSLKEDYMDELNICNAGIDGIIGGLSTVWNRGRPYKHGVVPFGNTTNYDFIIKSLIGMTNLANEAGFDINQKVKVFNRKHPNPPLLQTLKRIIVPNNLPPRLKRGLKQFPKWP